MNNDRSSPLFKSLVASHGLPRHLYFIIITLVSSYIVAKINLKLDPAINNLKSVVVENLGDSIEKTSTEAPFAPLTKTKVSVKKIDKPFTKIEALFTLKQRHKNIYKNTSTIFTCRRHLVTIIDASYTK